MTREQIIEYSKRAEQHADHYGDKEVCDFMRSVREMLKQGHWKEEADQQGRVFYMCSECGHGGVDRNMFAFCPSCGAKMPE